MTTRKLHFIGSVPDDWQLYSDRSTDYTIGSPIGFGASSVVYAAVYNPSPPDSQHPIPCALKVLDLDALPPHSLALLQRETQLMSLSKHPNLLRVRGSWIDGHKLYIALRLMNKGSTADVMHYGWPGGMEEEVVRCILKQALEGLNYLHINGFIHRDVKAANLLVDDDGTVLLGDLGVAVSLTDDSDMSSKPSGSRVMNFDPVSTAGSSRSAPPSTRPGIGKRGSFVGTPCWMAPELIQGHRYDSKADIWSFAITAIELTQGRPPRSRESAHNVLLQTVQGKPPTLDRVGGLHQYSRAFKDIVDACVVKDPSKRPTAAQLLQTPFFKSAKKKSYLVSTILDGLPPLTMRQERRRRQPSVTSHGTIDSWDFNVTEINSPIPSGSRRGGSRSVSRSGSFDVDSHHESARPDVHPRFELPNRTNDIKEDPATNVRPIIVSPPSYPTPANLQGFELEKEENEHFLSGPQPPLLSSSCESSGSAKSRAGYEAVPRLDSVRSKPPPAYKSSSSGVRISQFAPRSVPAPIPIPRSKTSYFRKSSFSSPAEDENPAPSSSPPGSPGLWQRLTGTTPRNAMDYELPVREKKNGGLSRILSRRSFTSLSQRPVIS